MARYDLYKVKVYKVSEEKFIHEAIEVPYETIDLLLRTKKLILDDKNNAIVSISVSLNNTVQINI